MPDIRHLCDCIAGHLQSLQWPVAATLAPGISKEEVLNTIGGLLPQISESVLELYNWKNGPNTPSGKKPLLPNYWYFLSIQEAAEFYKILTDVGPVAELVDDDEDPEDFLGWDRQCLPVFTSGTGDFLGVRCDGVQDDVIQSTHFAQPTKRFVSLKAMLTSYWEAYKAEAIFIDDNEMLRCDCDLFLKISRPLNPGIENPISL